MKKILLWDPRQPTMDPIHLEVDDAIASASVRAGVAAAQDPAEAGMLSAGAPLDPANPVPVTIWTGPLKRHRRVVLPASVAEIAVGAGLAVLPIELAGLAGAAQLNNLLLTAYATGAM